MLFVACNSQENAAKPIEPVEPNHLSQIGQYVTSVYEDSNGHLWFGTIQYGIARYDGKTLRYFTERDGLPSNRVTKVIEDKDGVFWLSTGQGLSKFDGERFINFSLEGDFNNMIGSTLIDSKGVFWVGTWGGVYTFDGKTFTHFPLPNPVVQTAINKDTENWITEIKEDAQGNIWFGRDAYGACMYDGEVFTHVLKKDGLNSNSITEIVMDKEGDIWFGARIAEKDNPDVSKRIGKGGINKLSNNTILSFPEIKGFYEDDVYEIYNDNVGNIFIGTAKNGVYKYDGKTFSHYKVPISVMCMMHDKKGNLWLAGAGGLYKINLNGELINVTRDGPWD